jgi:excinuclease ABC subunit C
MFYNAPMQEKLKKILDKIPHSSGVYKFLNDKQEVLYIGKAKDLRKRVANYFRNADDRGTRIQKMVEQADDISFLVTNSDIEALILEDNLIKESMPKYNVLLRDDKTFQYIKVTVKDDYPEVYTVRRIVKDGARYFGPKTSGSDVMRIMESVKRIFRLCPLKHITLDPKGVPLKDAKVAVKVGGTSAKRPCLDYHINRCIGPCAGMVTPEEYHKVINQVVEFLEGNHQPAIAVLKGQMMEYAAEKKFERAGKLRDQIQAIERDDKKQIITDTHIVDRDIIAFVSDLGKSFFNLFQVRGGRLIGQENFVMEGEDEPSEIMETFLRDYYSVAADIPSEIIISVPVLEQKLLEDFIGRESTKRIHLIHPGGGQKDQLVMLAEKNARSFADQSRARWQADERKAEKALGELKLALKLAEEPKRIECYDISHLGGTETVGSMVVFKKGEAAKADYRQFRLKWTKDQIDDFRSLAEVLRRRLNYLPAQLPEGYKMQKGSVKLLGVIMKGLKPEELKTFYTITHGKRVCAYGRLLDLSETIPMVVNLWVDPKERGKRFGHLVMRKLIETSKKKRFYIYCHPELELYYLSFGFEAIHQPPAELEKYIKDLEKDKKLDHKLVLFAYQKKKKDLSFETKPDLIVIDGGKGQLSSACEVLKEKGLNIPIISLAKRLEEVFVPERPVPMNLPANSDGGYLLQRLRDEAHRFAIEHNRSSRDNKMVQSALDKIMGVGPKLKKKLLTYYGSVDKIRAASQVELEQIAGEKVAKAIKENL